MPEVFGIDFGTTNSATVGLPVSGGARRYGDSRENADMPFPSIVAIDKMTGKIRCIGVEAKRKRLELLEQCEVISSPKRYLGTPKSWQIGNKTWYPEDIVAEILRGLKTEVSARAGREDLLKEAVISIPVRLSPSGRRSLRNAARKVGIKVLGFVSEPTAALYKHHKDLKQWNRIAVFDWGGGTLDITVIETEAGMVHELAADGVNLGGDDLDQIIALRAHEKFIQKVGANASFEEMPVRARDELLEAAEHAKIALSMTGNEQPFLVGNYGQYGELRGSINRKDLLSLLEPQFERVLELLRSVVTKQARLSFDELGCILMVGGSSKLLGLHERVQKLAGDCLVLQPGEHSDWDVAHGAALLCRNGGNHVLGKTIGIQLSDESFFPILRKGEEVSHKIKSMKFGLVEDSPTACFNFYQSDHVSPDSLIRGEGEKIDTLLVPTFGFVNEKICLDVNIDEDLFLNASARSSHMGEVKSHDMEYEKMLYSYKLPVEPTR